ncbi:nitric oxide reductase transcriptional regulator NorR [Thalassotalea sp. Y01]|uniref:nitric oxide reductase transcriptional regulator NorR n=1 Tax=Thalassotalea sp. Y01 TaxID=2729613 RepID=UPI00145E5B8A|nr:nitric oxide reductase transcriptional regulator NorR [Thalassotalea sp. Y01]NMP17592.1 nitric oxide reductase transcriptional regulator NorR [Thalassotalea sp. Y01]
MHISQTALLELSLDLARSLDAKDRFDQLLSTIRKVIACEAVALLTVKGEVLVPLAQQGLSKDVLGRRFQTSEHPRLLQISQSNKVVRFSRDCPLPDPYDGLLLDRDGDLPVHACMGIPLSFNKRLIGVLTLDSLTPNVFDDIPERTLEIIAIMAAVSLNNALNIELLESRYLHSQQVMAELNVHNDAKHQYELIGNSETMVKLKHEIQLVAPSDFSVLIEGASGTGKELVAHNIHLQSKRAEHTMVYVNCAALPENLIESELFGHVKGAFTGADKDRAGKFVVADGGTLFLDEVGELPLAAQSKLLRALQSNEIQKVGQDSIINVDVRVIAATNRDLKTEVEHGRFRSDLFHRLNVYPIHVPALQHRLSDIDLLAGYFIESLKRKLGINQLRIDSEVIAMMGNYDWPGNIRELEHFINRAALSASARATGKITTIIRADCQQLLNVASNAVAQNTVIDSVSAPAAESINLKQHLDGYQRQLIKQVLEQEQGNWSKAAKRLQIDRANLQRLAKRLNIVISKQVS